MNQRPRSGRPIVIAGGGTGGHAVPALAVAQALVRRGHDRADIRFVGSRRGLEATLVPEAGFAISLLPGRGIPRRPSLTGLAAAAALAAACVMALWLLGRHRPAVVLSVGGYASLPCAFAAVVLRVPLVLTDQNAVAGASNRLVGRFAAAAAVAFPGTDLPRAVLTGTPVRDEVVAVDRSPEGRAKARAVLDLPEDVRVVAVTGGSLGARTINRAAVGLARRWSERPGIALHHVVGRRDWADVAADAPPSAEGGLLYRAVEYEDRMPTVLAAADVMVCRAGGSTVAELTAVGVASILVPLPHAPGDHQSANAAALARAGAAVVVSDDQFDTARLADLLGQLLDTPGRLQEMEEAARSLGRPGAADLVAELVESTGASGGRR
ncbi:MAG TPA: undecaprenyldiphospho-muramoylpentapeptide beta-N-acetylglucosaminyltransferase [Acidimicrobiales bacterium]|nr:undecaprenyldiphospho-muramoylpentapeptide beta-N-acetylglucosaminyltransferase [Acidimicrobiales bacterium]